MRNLFNIFKRIPQKEEVGKGVTDSLKRIYLTFQDLLRENNHVLSLMADLEEKLSGEFLFDRHYVDTTVQSVSDGVLKIIDHINFLAGKKYRILYTIHEDIRKEIESVLSHRLEIPVSPFTLPMADLTKDMLLVAGGKISHLGEIRNRLHLRAPEGFVISSTAFRRFLEHNGFALKINEMLSGLDVKDPEGVSATSRTIQDMVLNAEFPPEALDAIVHSLRKLSEEVRQRDSEDREGPLRVSVRSSAVHEDGEFSFAGQYATFLNVSPEDVAERYKGVVASLFTPRAIFYFKTKGFSEDDMVMAAGVLRMIDARAGGVLYTRDPNDPGKELMIINGLWGLGTAVVDGLENTNTFLVARGSGDVAESRIPGQESMIVCSEAGDTVNVPIPEEMKNKPCLTNAQIKELHDAALTIEGHYGRPQDIEWAVDLRGKVFILQSRPLKIFSAGPEAESVPRKVEGFKLLIDRGIVACRGIASGKAFVLRQEEDLDVFPDGAVLIARHTSTKFVTVMEKASAVITDVGSTTGHMASLSREYQVPTILDTGSATKIIRDGVEITVDAINGNIYEGRVEELLIHAARKKEPFRETHLFRILEKVLKLIVPLSLIDPDKDDFRAENCRTLHDITRFTHEMAMAVIFKTGKGEDIDSFEDIMSAITFAESGEAKRLGSQTCTLRAGIPMDAHLLDIDGGLRKRMRKALPEDVTSIPLIAFLRGMTVMRWPGARPADVKGFLGMVASTASIPEEELRRTAARSYAVISQNYMNFSIRLGYHFSLVEAYAGEQINDNYIKFFFKGGGAVWDRKLRRVRLITEILKKLDFRVKVTKDVINAMLSKYRLEEIEGRLEVMGKLTAYTKQLDMVMYNDAVTDMFIEDFIRDHMKRYLKDFA